MKYIVYNVHLNSFVPFFMSIIFQTPLQVEFQFRFCQNRHLSIFEKKEGGGEEREAEASVVSGTEVR